MKKKLVWAFLLISLAACHDDEVTPRNILSITALEDIRVAYATEFQDITLPSQVSVLYSDNSTEDISVTFSQGSYNPEEAGTYALEGTLTLTSGTTNDQGLKASVKVMVAPLRLKSVSQDGDLMFEYFYDSQNRLDYFKVHAASTEFHYTYSTDHKVTQRIRQYGGNEYLEKYFYHANGTLDRIEFYTGETLSQTYTYTYLNGKISRFDKSDGTFREFEYDGQGNISKVSFDIGNSWNYTYFTDKNFATPLVLDWANPQNQTVHPVATFTYVELSSYTATYTYNEWDYPTEEVRTYPGDGNSQTTFTYVYE
jgi:YD repeat-containing protein